MIKATRLGPPLFIYFKKLSELLEFFNIYTIFETPKAIVLNQDNLKTL